MENSHSDQLSSFIDVSSHPSPANSRFNSSLLQQNSAIYTQQNQFNQNGEISFQIQKPLQKQKSFQPKDSKDSKVQIFQSQKHPPQVPDISYKQTAFSEFASKQRQQSKPQQVINRILPSKIQNQQIEINDKSNSSNSFSDYYRQHRAQCITQLAQNMNEMQLQQLIAGLQEEISKKQRDVEANREGEKMKLISYEKYNQTFGKYQRYKNLYAQEMALTKKLKEELKKIYEKVKKME